MQTALLIIDMQNDFVLPGAPARIAGAQATVGRIAEVLTYFRSRALPVFHVIRAYRADGSDIEISRRAAFLAGPQYVVPGTKGAAIVAELTPAKNEYQIVKPRFSAFFGTELELLLRRLGVERLVICGTQYPNCIRATAFDGLALGYDTTILTDGTSAASEEIAAANIRDLRNVGIRCLSFADYQTPQA